jgi:Na+/melibiose symporter-like transporter
MSATAAALASPLPRAALLAYSAFSVPLAMAALPLYVHLPKLYGADLGVALEVVGLVLLLTRIVDAASDPAIGWLVDRSAHRHRFVAAAAPLLALGMLGLLAPQATGAPVIVWLTALLVMTYAAFSLGSIGYQAWGAQLSTDAHERTRVTATREAFALAGVMLAVVLPELLGGINAQGLARFGGVFAVLVMLGAALTVLLGPRPSATHRGALPIWPSLRYALANPRFRWLLGVFVFSGIAASVPSTLFLFFVADVLEASAYAGLFLLLYFAAGAIGMPVWLRLAKRHGKKRAWLASMVLAVVAFVWAYALGPGDLVAYGAVCVFSGMALGADLALAPSLLADVIDRDARPSGSAAGSYFGLWTFVTKANLAVAAGVALPLVSALGYAPGKATGAAGLAVVYCLIPCALKLVAAAILAAAPLDSDRQQPRI